MLETNTLQFIQGCGVTISCYSDKEFMQLMNKVLPNVDFVSLASSLQIAPRPYGCEWFKAEWYSFYRDVDEDGQLIFLHYEATTTWGPLVLMRDISVEDGSLVGNNSYLRVPDELQGKGISRRLNAIVYEIYKAAGVKIIRVTATLEAGGYVWALAGFYATDEEEVRAILDLACKKAERNALENQTSTLTPTLCNSLKKRVDLHYGINSDKRFPMQAFSSLDCGEEILKGTEWLGELDLADLSQMSIFNEYLKKGMQ